MNREELAWAAGFYDGEGHCGLSKQTKTWQKKNQAKKVLEGYKNQEVNIENPIS